MPTRQDQITLANLERRYLDPPDVPSEPEPKEAGYSGMGSNEGIFVPEENALAFALERCGMTVTDKTLFECEWGEGGKGFVEWFFSGCWIREGGET